MLESIEEIFSRKLMPRRKISFKKARELLDSGRNVLLIDVRTPEEYNSGHASGAILLPLDEIDESSAAEAIPGPDTPVILYCRSGRRSLAAARLLHSLGYFEIYDIGGLSGWPYGIE